MSTKSQMVLPPKCLVSCIAGGIVRDTRQADLSDSDRLNYFPGSPLFTVTLTLEGRIHIGDGLVSLDQLRRQPAAPRRLFQPPRTAPHVSWNPGPLLALTLAFYPDAWRQLGGGPDGSPPACILPALAQLEHPPLEPQWPAFWGTLQTLWSSARHTDPAADWPVTGRLRDWAMHMLGTLSATGVGHSMRTAQRHMRHWTGHNRKTLEFFARIEDLHRLRVSEPDASAAELAIDAGFADQSHMGRALKRATGFSPVALNQRIANDEAFWCYRLLGERF